MSFVIEHVQNEHGTDTQFNWLLGDFITIMSAGTEPVLCTLVFLIYHLSLAPNHIKIVRTEIASLDDICDNRALQMLPHLNASINETLRLHPPVPSGGLRDTPPEGLQIGERSIPGYTTVLIPQYSLGQRKDCYERAAEFVPERWYSRPEMVMDKTAYIPFSAGNHVCPGQNLALMEVRLATALLIAKYDISLAPGEVGHDVSEKLEDLFVATPGPLHLVFHKRKD